MTPIANYKVYDDHMAKSLIDKMFFVDKVEPDIVVDFGCADGAMLKGLKEYYPKTKFIGYDNDKKQLVKARENVNVSDYLFTDDWNTVVERVKNGFVAPAIVLSSIVHEIYTYSRPEEIDEFWDKVFGIFRYVIIRDMIPSKTIDRASDLNDVMKVYRKYNNSYELNDFTHVWGTIEQNKNLTHFLLKYRYKENWKREVKENYLPLYREDLLALVPKGYEIVYHEHYVLPFIRNNIQEEFGIELKDNTHLKMILQKVNKGEQK